MVKTRCRFLSLLKAKIFSALYALKTIYTAKGYAGYNVDMFFMLTVGTQL